MTTDTPPVPAATLVLMRDRPGQPPALLMVRREQAMAFAGGAWVFPGGRIDEGDVALGGDGPLGPRSAAVAAIRETLEEVAVAVGLSPLPSPDSARALQSALLDGEPFAALLARSGLSLDLSPLVPFARWAPKMNLKRRFDTLFLIASAPAGDWPLSLQPGECAAAEWVGADEMLARVARGEAQAIFPTKRNLERLAALADFESAAADAARHGTERIVPWVEEIDGVAHVRIPEDAGYPVTSELLSSAIRA